MTNLFGLALGPSAVAAITDFAFADDQALKYSLAVLPVIVCLLAALLVGRGLKHYRWALNAAGNTYGRHSALPPEEFSELVC
jgi:hypothetical protein